MRGNVQRCALILPMASSLNAMLASSHDYDRRTVQDGPRCARLERSANSPTRPASAARPSHRFEAGAAASRSLPPLAAISQAIEAAGVEFHPDGSVRLREAADAEPRLEPQARPHALAELEATIAKAKAERDRIGQSVSRASGDDELRRAEGLSANSRGALGPAQPQPRAS